MNVIGELFDMKMGDNVVMAMIDPMVTVIPEFRDYVERCRKNKDITPEELLKVAVIQEVGKYYYEKRKECV